MCLMFSAQYHHRMKQAICKMTSNRIIDAIDCISWNLIFFNLNDLSEKRKVIRQINSSKLRYDDNTVKCILLKDFMKIKTFQGQKV